MRVTWTENDFRTKQNIWKFLLASSTFFHNLVDLKLTYSSDSEFKSEFFVFDGRVFFYIHKE